MVRASAPQFLFWYRASVGFARLDNELPSIALADFAFDDTLEMSVAEATKDCTNDQLERLLKLRAARSG